MKGKGKRREDYVEGVRGRHIPKLVVGKAETEGS